MQEISATKVKIQISDFKIIVEIPIAWGEMDAYAHLNNIYFFRYFEIARMEYFKGMNIPMDTAQKKIIGPILSHTECKFIRPLVYPEKVRVGAKVSDLQEDRFTMQYLIINSNEDSCAIGTGTIIPFDYALGKKANLPDDWHKKIVELESL